MKSLEFRTRIGADGEIHIPQYIKQKTKKGSLVSVTIFDEGVEECHGKVMKVGKTPEERKRFWEQYEFDGIWNGE